jgi:hypothetical protein
MQEYQDISSHNVLKNSKSEQNNMKNMETYSEEVKLGNKSVKITLEFPCKVDQKDIERFEENMRQIYLYNIQTRSGQMACSAVHSTPLNGKSESISRRNDQ